MWLIKLKKALKMEKSINIGELFTLCAFFVLFIIATIPLLISDKSEWKGILMATLVSLLLNLGFYSLGTLFFNEIYYTIIFGLISTYIFTFLTFFLGDVSTNYKKVKLTKAEVRDYRINRLLNGRTRGLF